MCIRDSLSSAYGVAHFILGQSGQHGQSLQCIHSPPPPNLGWHIISLSGSWVSVDNLSSALLPTPQLWHQTSHSWAVQSAWTPVRTPNPKIPLTLASNNSLSGSQASMDPSAYLRLHPLPPLTLMSYISFSGSPVSMGPSAYPPPQSWPKTSHFQAVESAWTPVHPHPPFFPNPPDLGIRHLFLWQ